jgi:hypothetical protein
MIQTELFPTAEGELAMRRPSPIKRNAPSDMPSVIERLATISSRPRYAFMVLNLIARAAGESGEAGPYVVEEGNAVRLRDWLCDALSPMARRDPRRIALTERVRVELEGQDGLPKDSKAAADAIDLAVRLRVRALQRQSCCIRIGSRPPAPSALSRLARRSSQPRSSARGGTYTYRCSGSLVAKRLLTRNF